jgi:predicted secreted protein
MDAEPELVELVAGERYDVELPGLGTAGYVWDDDVESEHGVVTVEWKRGEPRGSAPRPVGMSAAEVATIRAVRPGTVAVRLYQHRRWEPADRVRDERRLLVTVRPSGS